MYSSHGAILEAQALATVLEAVADLNAEFLAALVESAAERPEHFPLPQCLRPHFSRLSGVQCRERGRCGVFLADAAFTSNIRWGLVAADDDRAVAPPKDEHWLSTSQALVLAHSVLLVAWHAVHATPSLVSVLLGMNDEAASEFGKLSLSDLTSIARARPNRVRPRWSDRADVWAGIIACGDSSSLQEPMTILRCLKASATGSRRMLNSTAV
jgi:hypothetical protein